MNIKLLIDGGNMKPGPAIAQQIGPLGINMGQVISKINEATKEFKGMKVPVKLDINEKTKDFTVETSSPPTSELLKKELNLEKGTSDHRNIKVGNASIEDVIKITKIKYSNMLEKDFKTAVKSILGTCASIGILVENQKPNELIHKIDSGRFEQEINAQSTETDPEKRKRLDEHFTKLKEEQEAKLEEERKAAEEAAEAAAEEGKEGAVPVEGEAKIEEKKEEEKPEEKSTEEKK